MLSDHEQREQARDEALAIEAASRRNTGDGDGAARLEAWRIPPDERGMYQSSDAFGVSCNECGGRWADNPRGRGVARYHAPGCKTGRGDVERAVARAFAEREAEDVKRARAEAAFARVAPVVDAALALARACDADPLIAGVLRYFAKPVAEALAALRAAVAAMPPPPPPPAAR